MEAAAIVSVILWLVIVGIPEYFISKKLNRKEKEE
jgi:hypothetical protein